MDLHGKAIPNSGAPASFCHADRLQESAPHEQSAAGHPELRRRIPKPMFPATRMSRSGNSPYRAIDHGANIRCKGTWATNVFECRPISNFAITTLDDHAGCRRPTAQACPHGKADAAIARGRVRAVPRKMFPLCSRQNIQILQLSCRQNVSSIRDRHAFDCPHHEEHAISWACSRDGLRSSRAAPRPVRTRGFVVKHAGHWRKGNRRPM